MSTVHSTSPLNQLSHTVHPHSIPIPPARAATFTATSNARKPSSSRSSFKLEYTAGGVPKCKFSNWNTAPSIQPTPPTATQVTPHVCVPSSSPPIATPPFLFFSTYFSFLFHLFPIPFLILFPLPSSLLEPSSLTAQRPDYTTILSSLLTLFGYHFILP